jgi:micrococcal nuclease
VSVPDIWAYRARAILVVDGDTLDVVIDAGFKSQRVERLRLLGVNTPEMKGETRPLGIAARAYAEQWIRDAGSGDWPLVVRTAKSDAFGRYLAVVWRANDRRELNADLLAAGHATIFMV